jgi:autophagy-related protein 101
VGAMVRTMLGLASYSPTISYARIINAEIRQPKSDTERQQFKQNLAATLSKSLRTMLSHTSSEQGRGAVPPITNSEVSPFPLKISVQVGGVELG